MPGLIGFTRRRTVDERDILGNMQRMMRHQSFYVEDPLFVDDFVAATRTHKGIVQKDPQPIAESQVHVWLKGEFFNQDDLFRIVGPEAHGSSDPELLLRLYLQDSSLGILRHIDGIYSAVLYDTARKRVHLTTDRYGLGYFYWTVRGGEIAWASEVKAFLADPLFTPSIDRQTLEDFFNGGHPFENKTWFEGVELVPPATVLSWDIAEKKLAARSYWSWDDIRLRSGVLDEDDLVEEMGELWVDAVERRCREEARVGISLSGGLDSRAILAAMPDLSHPLHAMTVGNPRCDDVRYARLAAHRKGAEHHVYDLNRKNWISIRPSAIWWSDGHIDMKHMHGAVLINKVRQFYDINLSGIAGGPIMGGLYLERTGDDIEEERRIFSNRGRRFPPCHVQAVDDVFFHSRLPFYDNALVEAMLSTPPDVRRGHRLYKRMLLRFFPEFYRNIPWQKTGLPIGASTSTMKRREVADSIAACGLRFARKVGLETLQQWISPQFHHYDVWLRTEPGRQFVESVLQSRDSLYPNYVERTRVDRDWWAHLEGQNRTASICQHLTLEIWLQQVFNGKYRSGKWEDYAGARSGTTPAIARSAA